jgi:FtsP/CotA-like multicopper oxidase with cupredoxin domain
MLTPRRLLISAAFFVFFPSLASAQALPRKVEVTQASQACPRYSVGSEIPQPKDLRSANGELRVALTIRNSIDPNGHMRYCYADEQGNPTPTLRLHQGDALILTLKNEMRPQSLDSPSAKTKSAAHDAHANPRRSQRDPCMGGEMTAFSANIHFHGLSVPPVCHQDETLKTIIQPGDPPFEYRIQIPRTQPPGLYWYHPHVHGFSEEQVLGGASGALIVEGVERVNPRVAGLPERILVVRDEKMPDPSPSDKPDPNRPTKQLSINYVPVPFPNYPPAVIKMKPTERQFWRVLNAAADTYLDLHLQFDGKSQSMTLVSLDGVPLRYDQGAPQDFASEQIRIFLPPAGRAEFIVSAPPEGISGLLLTNAVYRGAGDENGAAVHVSGGRPGVRAGQDDVDPTRPLAVLTASADRFAQSFVPSAPLNVPAPAALSPLSSVRPTRKRTLYFSEKLVDSSDPKSVTQFFITEEGHTPSVFDPHAEPDIIVRSGEVEDWTIENRSLEAHAFHVHQLHFLVVAAFGVPWEEPALRDTINLPAWSGLGRFPSAILRMDFRNPEIVGTFPFHCHIMQHIDGGMMGTVRVEPPALKRDNN